MILPAEPLRLSAKYVARQRGRVLLHLLPMAVILGVLALWQGRAGWELWQDQRAWDEGVEVPVQATRPSDVRIIAGLVRHVRIYADVWIDGEPRAFVDDYYTMVTDAVGDGPLTARYDEPSGRVALSWSMDVAGLRWTWVVLFGLAFLLVAGVLGRLAWEALLDLRVARRCARHPEEVELEVRSTRVHRERGRPEYMELVVRVPRWRDPEDGASYREPAVVEQAERTLRLDITERSPILLDRDTKLLALRPDRGSTELLCLHDGFYPLALDPTARAEAEQRLAERRRGA